MKNANEGNMKIHHNKSTNQDEQSPTEKTSCQTLEQIREERNRLVRSLIQQPTDVLQDIAVLALGWAVHELEVMEREHRAPSDHLSWVYGFRIMGLADGQYGSGAMVCATNDGPQMFDTSTCTLVARLREDAQVGNSQ